jgi:putative transposase
VKLDKMLTGWRAEHEWLRAGASVPQQQIIRDFARSRAKALKDIKARLPMQQRAGMPAFKKKHLAEPTTSDDHDLPHPEHGKKAAAVLARYQKMMARRRPPKGHAASKSYRTARRQAARLHKKVARQRQDTAGQELRARDARPGWSGPGW